MSNATLSIWLWSDGLSFSIGGEQPCFVPVAPGASRYQQTCDAILSRDELLQDFDSVTCCVSTSRVSVMPMDGVAADEAQRLYDFSMVNATSEEVVLCDEDDTSGVRFMFGLDADVAHFLRRTYPDILFCHPLCNLHRRHAPEVAVGAATRLAVDVARDALHIVVYRDRKLVVASRYETTSTDSMAYFIMNTWQECGLDVLHDVLVVEPSASTPQELPTMLSTWVRHVVDVSTTDSASGQSVK